MKRAMPWRSRRRRGAEQYASQIYAKAQSSLQMAENALTQDAGKNQVISAARQTIQFAEDARALAVQRENAERIQKEKEAAAAEAAAKAKAEADAQAAAEAKRQAELTAAKEAQMKAQAQAQAAEAKAAAAQGKGGSEQAAIQAKAEAASEEAKRAQAATAALRAQLLQQLNEVLQTTDTPRGLVVNMADVLFETGKYALSMDAQLKLAKLSGIIQAHPGLNLAIEGYTDNTGTPDFNMKLSQQRADAVRQFLITQGLSPDTITSKGMGQADPIADNSTAAGRKQNRRVEIIVSGQVIGVISASKNSRQKKQGRSLSGGRPSFFIATSVLRVLAEAEHITVAVFYLDLSGAIEGFFRASDDLGSFGLEFLMEGEEIIHPNISVPGCVRVRLAVGADKPGSAWVTQGNFNGVS